MIHTHGANSLTRDVVNLNGVKYPNYFYKIDSNNVGSTFVDEVQLPEGYEKLKRVWYNGNYDNSYPSLIETDFDLPFQFGNIYCGFNLVHVGSPNYRIFISKFNNSSDKRISYFSDMFSTTNSKCLIWNTTYKDGTISKSVQFSDDNKMKENILTGTLTDLPTQVGNEPISKKICLLSSRGLCYFRFLFVADRNLQVTFTAIPCKHGNDYGLYDIVADKFYTHADLTGD